MATSSALHRQRWTPLGQGSRYDRGWTTAALGAAAVFGAMAVLQSPRLPLLCLVIPLAAIGGILFLRQPLSTAPGRREYGAGVLRVAGLVLVAVGVGHHVEAGLALLAVLVATAPFVLRWIAGH
jgi:hypothetical protein